MWCIFNKGQLGTLWCHFCSMCGPTETQHGEHCAPWRVIHAQKMWEIQIKTSVFAMSPPFWRHVGLNLGHGPNRPNLEPRCGIEPSWGLLAKVEPKWSPCCGNFGSNMDDVLPICKICKLPEIKLPRLAGGLVWFCMCIMLCVHVLHYVVWIHISTSSGFRFVLDPHFDSVLVLLRWSRDLRFGCQPRTKACWWVAAILWQGTTPWDVLGEHWVMGKSVHPCHQYLHRFCRWWWSRSSNWLCSVWLWYSSKQKSPDQRKCGNFKLWSLRGLERRLCIRLKTVDIFMVVWICGSLIFWTMGQQSLPSVFLSEGKHYALLSTAKCRPHYQRRSLNRIRDVGCRLADEAPDPSRSVHRVGWTQFERFITFIRWKPFREKPRGRKRRGNIADKNSRNSRLRIGELGRNRRQNQVVTWQS